MDPRTPERARARTATEELRERRSGVRDPGAVLVPDASGGDPIPWEEPQEEGPRGTE